MRKNTANQAWESIDADDYSLAIKLARRAAKAHPGNPRIWNDLGLILLLVEEQDAAVEAFQAAISLAPEFADPYVHLATISMQSDLPTKPLV